MLSFGTERIDIFMNLADKTDIETYNNILSENALPTMSMDEFFAKSGQVMYAVKKYPELSYVDAFIKYKTETNGIQYTVSDLRSHSSTESRTISNCGSCGGGQVK